MEKDTITYIKEKTADLLAAPMCCQELRAAAEAYLAAIGTDKEAEALKAYFAEIAASITTVDNLIALTESELGQSIFGAEGAAAMAAHAHELKEAGRPWCDCPACAACEALLAKKDEAIG